LNDQANQWGNLYTGIDKDVQGTASSMVSTLITGKGSFHDEMIKALDDIGISVVTAFTKPFTDAIASLLAGGIADLLGSKGLGGISSALEGIGKSATSAVSSLGGLGGLTANSAASIGAAGTGSIGDIVGTGDTLAGVGESGGSVASVAGQAAGMAVSRVVGLVTGAISAVTGVIGIFQAAQNETTDNAIEANTRVGALYTLAALQELQDIQNFNYNSLFPEVAGINSMLMDFTNGAGPLGAALMAFAAPKTDYTEYNADTLGSVHDDLLDIKQILWGQVHDDMTIIEGKLDTLNQSVVQGGGSTGTFAVNGVTQTVTKVGQAGRRTAGANQ
jgi:uncharacterized membrane protein YedE/YeeE